MLCWAFTGLGPGREVYEQVQGRLWGWLLCLLKVTIQNLTPSYQNMWFCVLILEVLKTK